VLRQLVSAQARNLLPGSASSAIPVEPFRQLWYAAAEQSLATMQIEPIQARPSQPQVLTAPVNAGGARLFPIRLPEGYRLVLGVNGSPLMQMSVFAADGTLLEPSGPLRVLSLPPQARSPVQLLVANEGVAPALITLSLRADPPPPELPPGPPVSPGVVPETPGRSPAAEPPSPDQPAPAPPDRPSAREAEPAADSQPPAAAQ